MQCPKCGTEQKDKNMECVACGIVFKKYLGIQQKGIAKHNTYF